MDDPVIEAGRVRRGGMSAEQREWWNLPNFIRLFVGGYGSGKTLTLCKRMIALALQNAPHPVLIVSPTYSMASETVIDTLIQLLDGKKTILAREGFDWREKKGSPYKFTILYHGRRGRILVYSGENPRRLKGPNIAAAGIDEPFIQDEEVFKQIVARVRHPGAIRREINLAGTPEQLNWGYELAEGELAETHDSGIVRASTTSNPTLDSGYVDRLRATLDERTAQAYVEGAFVNLASGLVYHAFSRIENVVSMQPPPGAEWGVGMDFNVNPMAMSVFWVSPRGHMHVVEEIELPNSDTQDACAVIRQKYGNRINEVYPDPFSGRHTNSPGGKTDYDYIREAGFHVNKRNDGGPLRRDRYNATNGKFRAEDGQIGLTIEPSCKKLIKYLQAYSHELRTTKAQDSMSHLLDAFSYPVEYLFPANKRALSYRTKLTGY